MLIDWALWSRRSRSVSIPLWTTSLVLVLATAFTAQLGMRELQRLMQRLDNVLIARFASGRGFDPKEVRTALGSIGRMKLSGDIVLRVDAEGTPPPLLREASYKMFLFPSWTATRLGRAEQNFVEVIPESDLTTWKLLPDKPTRKHAIVSGFLSGGQGLIPVPAGVAKSDCSPDGCAGEGAGCLPQAERNGLDIGDVETAVAIHIVISDMGVARQRPVRWSSRQADTTR